MDRTLLGYPDNGWLMACARVVGTYDFWQIPLLQEVEAMRVAEAIEPDEKTEAELRRLSKGRRVEARVQQRARVILLAAQGWQNKDIADEVKLDRRQVALWRRRFIEGGVQALLLDASRSGRTPSVTSTVESHILSTTLYEQPAAGTHWSTRTLASYLGLSASTIRRVWLRHGIKPHSQGTSKVSQDPLSRFEDALVDVAGLYMNPRERALVLSCAEKSQIPKLNRTSSQRAGTMHHDHWRNGTAALFAGLKKLESTVISMCQDRHRHEDWLKFLRLIDRKTPKHLQLHLIVENQATHKRPKVQAWLAQHPRFVVHSTPANGTWLNMVKRFFCDISEHGIRRDSFTGVADLQQAIAQYVEHLNRSPKPFNWTVSDSDTAQVTRAKSALARWAISAEKAGASHP
ncbi:IS630 family transposase [Hydrogenophaga sp.]|uniref:IS630 family transposase n=1 Tax=Hydrogenophaga sp. TaxID=1904254 RepID=UPI0025C355DD|nr:IS630 family transposase [Hydrogenophaga sp.]MBT9463767.1 IS630 family transposase [Hydrogenophaga sp.]